MNFIAWMIVASEIAFWILIVAGLATRYLLKRKKLGLFFLALTPVIDLILLITASVDMYHGATATWAHGIAAVYIGVSIVFGKSMIRWADDKFRYFVTKEGGKPAKKYGTEFAVHELKGFLKHVLSYGLGAGYLFILITLIQDPSRTEALSNVIRIWSVILGIDLVITVTYFIWPKTPSEKSKSLHS